jgi:hypothetical protein
MAIFALLGPMREVLPKRFIVRYYEIGFGLLKNKQRNREARLSCQIKLPHSVIKLIDEPLLFHLITVWEKVTSKVRLL